MYLEIKKLFEQILPLGDVLDHFSVVLIVGFQLGHLGVVRLKRLLGDSNYRCQPTQLKAELHFITTRPHQKSLYSTQATMHKIIN